MGEGLDPHAIARELGISLNTCRGYQKSILAKLGAHSQLEAVVIATRRGVIGSDLAPSARPSGAGAARPGLIADGGLTALGPGSVALQVRRDPQPR